MTSTHSTNPNCINSLDNEQWTPLHYACFEGHVEAILFLLSNSADLKIGNHFGSTPLHLTIGTGNVAATKALLDAIDDLEVFRIKNQDKQIPRQMLLIASLNSFLTLHLSTRPPPVSINFPQFPRSTASQLP